jgi:hypothetical protein
MPSDFPTEKILQLLVSQARMEEKLDAFIKNATWPDPIGWSGFNLSSCSALGLLPGQMTVLLRLLAQAR